MNLFKISIPFLSHCPYILYTQYEHSKVQISSPHIIFRLYYTIIFEKVFDSFQNFSFKENLNIRHLISKFRIIILNLIKLKIFFMPILSSNILNNITGHFSINGSILFLQDITVVQYLHNNSYYLYYTLDYLITYNIFKNIHILNS